MAKLEEVTSLLVDEIEEFKQSVDKLEHINTQLKNTKIQMDLIEFKSIMNEHEHKMENHRNSIEYFDEQIEAKLKNAKIYPNWAVIVFIVGLVFGIISTTSAFILNKDIETLEKEAYKKGVIDVNINIQSFFDKHPKSKSAFQKWEEKSQQKQ